MNSKIKVWVEAFRLRTLALSFALIIMGSAVAVQHGIFCWQIFLLALLTTLFLQILSNLSNDYGDSVSGADGKDRVGPVRTVQSGAISLPTMRRAMVIFSLLSLVAGVALLLESYERIGFRGLVLLFFIGLLCIVAAITYTVGKHPYGYVGLGDFSVFVFFGLVGVSGSYALYSGELDYPTLLLASAVGMLSIGVLNMNNLRDYESDKAFGKRTLVVKHGTRWARRYQVVLICGALLLLIAYILLFGKLTQLICLLPTPLLFRHLRDVLGTDNHDVIDGQLKKVSVSTMLISLLFMVGTLVGGGGI